MDSCPCLHGGRLYAGMWDGDGSPHPRGHRRGGGLDSCPVFTGAGSTRECGMGPRIREDTEGEAGWIPAPVFTGAGSTRECGMGPRIREDTEGEVGWIPAPVFTGAGSTRERGMGMGPRIREDTEGEVGWVPAPVFTGAGSAREQRQGALRGNGGWGNGRPRGTPLRGLVGERVLATTTRFLDSASRRSE